MMASVTKIYALGKDFTLSFFNEVLSLGIDYFTLDCKSVRKSKIEGCKTEM